MFLTEVLRNSSVLKLLKYEEYISIKYSCNSWYLMYIVPRNAIMVKVDCELLENILLVICLLFNNSRNAQATFFSLWINFSEQVNDVENLWLVLQNQPMTKKIYDSSEYTHTFINIRQSEYCFHTLVRDLRDPYSYPAIKKSYLTY